MIKLTTRITYPKFLDAPEKAVQKWALAGLKKAAEYIHRILLPRHFVCGATTTYHYAFRTPHYLRAKANRGIRDPLTFTGEMQRKLLQGARITVVAGKAPKINMREKGPFYLRLPGQAAFHRQPDMYSEITRRTEAEDKSLASIVHWEMVDQMKLDKEEKVTKKI
jgi:hypothetical protein